MFIVGIIAVYAVYTMLGGMIGFLFGVYDNLKNAANQSGVQVDPQMDQTVSRIKTFTSMFWQYSVLIVFISMVVYVLLESMRRRPEDYWG